ncbi:MULTISPECIES: DUF5615 family PIN-like protein [Olivibacter]|uniref:DUF5615 domain-containing protein n=2 Tax=Sphingobacteriaceae TaxID=84566 RepID=F4C9A8_SPHS2|nr:DUF5615 family PIN-like protein [Pseudosphingobacterium sp.]
MKVLVDMNLSPEWVDELAKSGITAIHWSTVGRFNAPDKELISWAQNNDCIIFTHDLDFGTALALTGAIKPSVIQVRTQDVTVKNLRSMIVSVLTEHLEILTNGALIIIDEYKKRIRILPLI